MNTRAAITAFDSYLKRSLEMDLCSSIPPRVLPVSTKPIGNFDVLVDREFTYISDLLKPGKRQRDEAHARIRSLLTMEAIVTDEVDVSNKDVHRIEKAIKAGKQINEVFPRLNIIDTNMSGEGTTHSVTFTKKHGAPVQFISGDDPAGAAAVREIDIQKKFYLSASDLAKKLKLTGPRTYAIRKHLSVDADTNCMRTFTFGKSSHNRFSDNAFNKLKVAIDGGVDMDAVWQEHRP